MNWTSELRRCSSEASLVGLGFEGDRYDRSFGARLEAVGEDWVTYRKVDLDGYYFSTVMRRTRDIREIIGRSDLLDTLKVKLTVSGSLAQALAPVFPDCCSVLQFASERGLVARIRLFGEKTQSYRVRELGEDCVRLDKLAYNGTHTETLLLKLEHIDELEYDLLGSWSKGGFG